MEMEAAVLAGARIGKHGACHRAETRRVVEYATGEPSGIGSDSRAMEPQLQTAVEIAPHGAISRFTRQVLRGGLVYFNLIH
jgi:hypothetical protein